MKENRPPPAVFFSTRQDKIRVREADFVSRGGLGVGSGWAIRVVVSTVRSSGWVISEVPVAPDQWRRTSGAGAED